MQKTSSLSSYLALKKFHIIVIAVILTMILFVFFVIHNHLAAQVTYTYEINHFNPNLQDQLPIDDLPTVMMSLDFLERVVAENPESFSFINIEYITQNNLLNVEILPPNEIQIKMPAFLFGGDYTAHLFITEAIRLLYFDLIAPVDVLFSFNFDEMLDDMSFNFTHLIDILIFQSQSLKYSFEKFIVLAPGFAHDGNNVDDAYLYMTQLFDPDSLLDLRQIILAYPIIRSERSRARMIAEQPNLQKLINDLTSTLDQISQQLVNDPNNTSLQAAYEYFKNQLAEKQFLYDTLQTLINNATVPVENIYYMDHLYWLLSEFDAIANGLNWMYHDFIMIHISDNVFSNQISTLLSHSDLIIYLLISALAMSSLIALIFAVSFMARRGEYEKI